MWASQSGAVASQCRRFSGASQSKGVKVEFNRQTWRIPSVQLKRAPAVDTISVPIPPVLTGTEMKLVIASGNPSKAREIGDMLSGLPVELSCLADYPSAPEVVENGRTFEENAVKKAVAIARCTGLHAMADDSGLCVDALGGRPGIYSARYAGKRASGRDLCRKLLKEMRSVPDEERTAHFSCSVVMAAPGGEVEIVTEGACHGRITRQMRGGRGFGYDPVFLYPPAGKTFAQMRPEEKQMHSHRGAAMRAFREKLCERFFADPGESNGEGEQR